MMILILKIWGMLIPPALAIAIWLIRRDYRKYPKEMNE